MTVLRRLMTSDIPFARDDAHRLLPAMIGCLVGFAALLLATGLSLTHTLDQQSRDVAGVMQIEVPADAGNAGVDKVTAQLRRTAGVDEVAVLGRSEMEALLKPWLGSDFSVGSLPVPTLIEVKTQMNAQGSTVDAAALRKNLAGIDSGIRVTERSPWVEQLSVALKLLQALVVLVAALLLICVIGMVVLVARTNLKLHFKTVGLLHMFGATDDYILRQFQWNGAGLAARGSIVGAGLAAVLFGLAAFLSTQMHSPVIPPIHFSWLHLIAFILLPLLTSLVALVATRVTVNAMLHHLH